MVTPSSLRDGAGPFKMSCNAHGTGQTWTAMTVTTQVPGTVGLSRTPVRRQAVSFSNMRFRPGSTDADFPLIGQIPAGTTCTGGADSQTCLIRAQNPIGKA